MYLLIKITVRQLGDLSAIVGGNDVFNMAVVSTVGLHHWILFDFGFLKDGNGIGGLAVPSHHWGLDRRGAPLASQLFMQITDSENLSFSHIEIRDPSRTKMGIGSG
jgi:hypothetical protein